RPLAQAGGPRRTGAPTRRDAPAGRPFRAGAASGRHGRRWWVRRPSCVNGSELARELELPHRAVANPIEVRVKATSRSLPRHLDCARTRADGRVDDVLAIRPV